MDENDIANESSVILRSDWRYYQNSSRKYATLVGKNNYHHVDTHVVRMLKSATTLMLSSPPAKKGRCRSVRSTSFFTMLVLWWISSVICRPGEGGGGSERFGNGWRCNKTLWLIVLVSLHAKPGTVIAMALDLGAFLRRKSVHPTSTYKLCVNSVDTAFIGRGNH